jgi:hypothetical protein
VRLAAVGPGMCLKRRSASSASAACICSAELGRLAAGVVLPTGMGLVLCWPAGPELVDQNGQIGRSFLRRQPAHIVTGRIEGGYTSAFEVICCDCPPQAA